MTLAAAVATPRPHRVECAWCKLELQAGREPVSHGICPDCMFATLIADLDYSVNDARDAVRKAFPGWKGGQRG